MAPSTALPHGMLSDGFVLLLLRALRLQLAQQTDQKERAERARSNNETDQSTLRKLTSENADLKREVASLETERARLLDLCVDARKDRVKLRRALIFLTTKFVARNYKLKRSLRLVRAAVRRVARAAVGSVEALQGNFTSSSTFTSSGLLASSFPVSSAMASFTNAQSGGHKHHYGTGLGGPASGSGWSGYDALVPDATSQAEAAARASMRASSISMTLMGSPTNAKSYGFHAESASAGTFGRRKGPASYSNAQQSDSSSSLSNDSGANGNNTNNNHAGGGGVGGGENQLVVAARGRDSDGGGGGVTLADLPPIHSLIPGSSAANFAALSTLQMSAKLVSDANDLFTPVEMLSGHSAVLNTQCAVYVT